MTARDLEFLAWLAGRLPDYEPTWADLELHARGVGKPGPAVVIVRR
jgi:hypothetical protein